MLHGMVQNEDDSWDLAQEAFLKAWRSIHQFQGRSSFYTWLYSLTVNLAFDSLRRKGRRIEVELDDAIPSSLPSPRANYRRTEISEHINAALTQLTPEHRAVIVLKEIEDLQYHEIAEILGISVGTVMSRLFYARKKLQSILRPIFTPVEVEKGEAAIFLQCCRSAAINTGYSGGEEVVSRRLKNFITSGHQPP